MINTNHTTKTFYFLNNSIANLNACVALNENLNECTQTEREEFATLIEEVAAEIFALAEPLPHYRMDFAPGVIKCQYLAHKIRKNVECKEEIKETLSTCLDLIKIEAKNIDQYWKNFVETDFSPSEHASNPSTSSAVRRPKIPVYFKSVKLRLIINNKVFDKMDLNTIYWDEDERPEVAILKNDLDYIQQLVRKKKWPEADSFVRQIEHTKIKTYLLELIDSKLRN